MDWVLARKDVGRRSSALAVLLAICCWSCAQDLLAAGVPVPRNVRPGKVPSTPATAPAAEPKETATNDASRSAQTKRYVERQLDLRQRLSTAARANYSLDQAPAPPAGEAVFIDDVPAPAANANSVPTAGQASSATPLQQRALEPSAYDTRMRREVVTPRTLTAPRSSRRASNDVTAEENSDRPAVPANHVYPGPTAGQAVDSSRRAPTQHQGLEPSGHATRAISIAAVRTEQAVPAAYRTYASQGPQPLEDDTPGLEPAFDDSPNFTEPVHPTPTEDNRPVFNPTPSGTPAGPFEVIEQSGELSVVLRRSKLLRTKLNVYRTAVVDPSICDVIQFTPREVSIVGKAQGATTITFWFEDDATHEPLTYLVRVTPDPEVPQRREEQYQVLQDVINGLFPDSKVRLTAVADKLLVQGQARDVEEAAQILAVIRGQAVLGNSGAGGFGLIDGIAADPLVQEETGKRLPATQIVNMLRVPGEQQVALRVKIAELSRSAARNFGVDLRMNFADGNLMLESFLAAAGGSAPSVIGHFDGDQINFGIHYLEKHGVVRLLSEPTLVTLSGQPASFVAGGEFAVPTVVGVGGAAAVTTDFRAFGAIITFLPVVLDKDRIRLQVSPEFSKINQALAVNNTPGLNTRAVATTVEMREGQTLAIAGLLDDSMTADLAGNVPFLYRVLGVRNVSRNETELLILVTPELVHPLDPEEVPPLPGFDVTEPTNWEFFAEGKLEGKPTLEYRSTVWPVLKQRYRSGGSAMISGPFGHGQ
jgi:pilus assembly protein CpaC